jgi:tRNA pseudouridine13 synthase
MSRMVLTGNAFRIRVRDLAPNEAARLIERFEAVREHGLPAYFDEQRFGSLRGGGGFAALNLVKGDAESALRAVIACPSREDRAHVRERKRRIRAHWNDFDGLPEVLEGTPMRAPVLHLVKHPGDHLGAFATLDREERRLYASAYTSAVWNRAVAALVRTRVPPADQLVFHGVAGDLVFPRLPAPLPLLATAVLPLPAKGVSVDEPEIRDALVAALAADGVTLDALDLDPRLSMDFRPTKRAIWFRPAKTTVSAPLADELNPGRKRVDLAFTLDRGLYATIVLKYLTHDVDGPKKFD